MKKTTTLEFDNKKVVTTEIKRPDGTVVCRTVESVLKSKSNNANNKAKKEFIKYLSEVANRLEVGPHTLNRLAYEIKEYKAKYNEHKWYIPEMDSTKASWFKASILTAKKHIDIYHQLFSKIKTGEIVLKDETKDKLKNAYLETCWIFILTYPDEKDYIPSNIFNIFMKSAKNKQIWETRLEQTKKCSEMGKEMVQRQSKLHQRNLEVPRRHLNVWMIFNIA